ncbi:hypothetical protein KVR01_010932 [Diaporthe batatas]|uniref:uncharacterized protein n=1 Tax=Diaporthe batatas TaxID=748121 RepID=UPI001D04DB1F|nr:uncharacterized protein KVR01_010932 [Diaporthe batatas]KAG8159271.1 hypothetical protein KVR01_010932 [Diaporthe batatas]
MLPRAGRLTGMWLRPRPTLRLGRNACHLPPAVLRPVESAQSTVPLALCQTQLSSRYGSSKAEDHTASRNGRGEPRGGDEARGSTISAPKKPSHPDGIGRLARAFVAHDPRDITVEFEKLGAPVTISQLWLRDACQCPSCVSESSGQKRFATCDIPSNLRVDGLKVLEDGGLEVSWANDIAPGGAEHVSTYPPAVLDEVMAARNPYRRSIPAREIWDSGHFAKDSRSREISYAQWMEDSPRFAEAFRNLHLWGLVVIKGVPQTEEAVAQVASRLGHLQSTFYGPTWDVISKPQAENVAYTNEFLCLHQDLMYLKEPPRIQVLHCLENSCEGGDSLFSDGVRAAHDLRINNSSAYHSLTSIPVDYHYAKGGNYWHNSHATIVETRNATEVEADPLSVRWSPPFQAPFWSAIAAGNSHSSCGKRAGYLAEVWQKAARLFKDTLEDPTNMVQFRVQPGDCVVFDNWRVLHGRRAFDTASGSRHLRGTYVEDQALTSTWLRLQREGLMFTNTNGDGKLAASQIIEAQKAERILGAQHDPVVLTGREAQA